MKPYKLILLLLFSVSVHSGLSQTKRVVSGVMRDSEGYPLVGVSIVVKGTTNGVVTDANGYYRIEAPEGAILVFSYVGFTTKEVPISSLTSEIIPDTPVKAKVIEKPSFKSSYQPLEVPDYVLPDTVAQGEGAAVFTSKTPSYSLNNEYSLVEGLYLDVDKINGIDINNERARIQIRNDEYFYIPHIEFYTSVSTNSYLRLPKLQNQYAQGRPINGKSQWRGPETGEILSWGPAINQLEFDGSDYPFDANGRLTYKGTGNGRAAKAYDPTDVFKNGYVLTNSLKVYYKTDFKEYSVFYSNKLVGGILPGYTSKNNYGEIKWKKKFRKIKIGSQLNIDDIKNNYLEGSPSNTMLMASILTTPATFDNTNGKNASEAFKRLSTYQINSNMQRSYAPGVANHPYWLVHNSPESESHQLLNGSFNMNVDISDRFEFDADTRYQYQKNDLVSGYNPKAAGIEHPVVTTRKEVLYSVVTTAGLRWDHRFNYSADISSSLLYTNYILHSDLQRNDIGVTDNSKSYMKYSLSRTEHNLNWTTNLSSNEGFILKMSHNLSGNNQYKHAKLYYAPVFALGVNVHDLTYLQGIRLKVKSNWGYSYSFIPLNFSYGKYNYQNIQSENFYNTSFNQEVIPDLSLMPEKTTKADLGLELSLFHSKLTLDADVYVHTTSNAIFPVSDSKSPVFKNIATTRMEGVEFELNFQQRIARSDARFRLIFDSYKSTVIDLYNGYDEVPLGGFSDVHTSLVENQPAGVVVGTAWLKDVEGNMIIGNDGFPLVANNLKVIATPDPDFTLGFETKINYKAFSTSILMEYRHGGKIWNGTSNVLSFLGLSEKTVEGRKINEYIFPGVTSDGSVNTTPVDFANPDKSMAENRWYRYGVTGVAEDALEDASCFRVREISITYHLNGSKLRCEISLFASNPILITNYSGTDPNVTLWEKSNTSGLDLFNMPSVSSIGLACRIKL